MLQLQVRVELAVITMKGYSAFLTGTSPSDCLVSYPGHLLGGRVLPLLRGVISVFYSHSQLGNLTHGHTSAGRLAKTYIHQLCAEGRCPWCNGYRRRIWTRRHEFKSWTWLIAFHIAQIPLGKVWIQIFSLQLWVNSRAD